MVGNIPQHLTHLIEIKILEKVGIINKCTPNQPQNKPTTESLRDDLTKITFELQDI